MRRGRSEQAGATRVSFGGGELVIDDASREVVIRGQTVALTATEWGVISTLAAVPGRVYTRYELINRVRGYEFDGYERTVDSHIKNLRRKLAVAPRAPEIITTVVGGGYRLGLKRDV